MSTETIKQEILIEFSGHIIIDAQNVYFVFIGESDDTLRWPLRICGIQWLEYTMTDRQNYILESLTDAQRDCEDGEYEQCEVSPFVE